MKLLVTAIALIAAATAAAQDTTARSFAVSGYAEVYYGYDFNRPAANNRPPFLYNHNRHNEFNLNLGFIKGSYASERVRANLAVAAGTYMNANYAAEPGTLKNIFEANAGYNFAKNLWLDVGILPSHIGFESAVGKDNPTLTRSLVAENSPYFESGAKLSYVTANGKWQAAVLALNGWQRISRVNGASLIGFGTQVQYKPSEKTTFNYSTFFGTDKPDTARLWRYYHNLYGIVQLTERLGLTAGFDTGTEQKTVNGNGYNVWYTPVVILRTTLRDKWAAALRGEYYSDKGGVLIPTGAPNGFKTAGFSLNIDYAAERNVLLRLEGRHLYSRDAVFENGGARSRGNTALTFCLAAGF